MGSINNTWLAPRDKTSTAGEMRLHADGEHDSSLFTRFYIDDARAFYTFTTSFPSAGDALDVEAAAVTFDGEHHPPSLLDGVAVEALFRHKPGMVEIVLRPEDHSDRVYGILSIQRDGEQPLPCPSAVKGILAREF